jgi:hypothetical protein
MTLMNPEVKTKWLAALRDPEAKQTKGCLRDNNGFCCLGVLTDIYLKEHDKVWLYDYTNTGFHFEGETDVLPKEVQKWAGLKNILGTPLTIPEGLNTEVYVDPETGTVGLAELNDTGSTFAEIADIIEAQL